MAVPRWDDSSGGYMSRDTTQQTGPPKQPKRRSKFLKKILFKKHSNTEENCSVFPNERVPDEFDTSTVQRRRVRPSRSRIMSDPTSSRCGDFSSPELDEKLLNKSASEISVPVSPVCSSDNFVSYPCTQIRCNRHMFNRLSLSDDLVNSFHKTDFDSARVHNCEALPKFVSPPSTVITAETNDVICHCQACCRCCPGNSPARTCSRIQSECDDLSYESMPNNCSYGDWKNPSCSPTSVHSWGHFSMRIDNRYKYRRSDYSSDSDDDGTIRSMSKQRSDSSLSGQLSHLPVPNIETYGVSPFKNYERKKEKVESAGLRTDKTSNNEEGVKPTVFRKRMMEMSRWFSEFSQIQKNLVLKGFLRNCDLPQMHLLSVKMEKNLHRGCPPNCEDIITWLPSQIAARVMLYLDPVSLCRASQVCKIWRQMGDEPSLWRRFCCQPKWRLSKAAEHKQVISHMSPEGSIQWKKVLAERFRLRNNWVRGRCTVRTFEGHSQGISCVQFDDTRIVSGSSDKTIKVWNIRTNAQWSVQTLVGHSGTVRCLHLEGNRLVSGSTDKSIKVWDLSTQESWSSIACKVTMIGHIDTVRCLQVDDDKVISGSYDKTLKIWDLKSGDCRRTLRGHEAAVLCIHFNETKIVSGSCDKTIKVWSFDGACLMTLNGHQDAVTCLQFDSTRIVSGSLDCNLKFWDIQTGDCVNTIDWKAAEGHTGVVRFLQADSWRLVSAADDKTIKVWSLETGQRLVTLRNHTDGVTCLQFNDFIIVSGSYDKTVKLWDFSCC